MKMSARPTPWRASRRLGAVQCCHASPHVHADSRRDVHGRRQMMAAMLALSSAVLQPRGAAAAEGAEALPETIYFGNGCFWGRQKDYVDAELQLGRQEVSAVAGYAGGRRAGPEGRVCYYYSNPQTVYESLGHAEVVQVSLSRDPTAAEDEFRRFARVYFSQFRETRRGMIRLDPQDAGPGYRNVVGWPGGVRSPLFRVFEAANVNGMVLREGRGNESGGEGVEEGDLLNTVWVVDSTQLPFYRAEQYHQYHNDMSQAFPRTYTQDLKTVAASSGRISPTGCPEYPF